MKIKIDNRQGDAQGYDFIVTRTGDGLGTEYDIDAGSQEPVSSDIMSDLAAKKINLEALFDGLDPFSTQGSSSKPQNQSTGFEKLADIAQNRPMQNRLAQPDTEPPIADDIAEAAPVLKMGRKCRRFNH